MDGLMDKLLDRRTLLKLVSAVSLAGCGEKKNGRGLKVVVAGAGIVGASIAYHLAKAGASVTVIDRKGPATHASRGTFAWINATWAKQPRNYHALTQEGVSGWGSLQKELNVAVKWGGSLEWFGNPDRQKKLAVQIAEQAEWGEPARMVDATEFVRLEPNVEFGDTDSAAFSGNDGAVDPIAATNALLAAAKVLGATVQFPCELQDVTMVRGRLSSLTTSMGGIKTDRLVLATGADRNASAVFAESDIPQRTTAGVIAVTAPLPPLLNRIVAAPGVHMHQRVDGRIVLGEQDGAPQTEAHAQRLKDRPNDFPSPVFAEQHAGRMLEAARRFLPAIDHAVIEDVFIGWRPLPVDGHPVLGASPNRPDVYLAVMHSGVSLAPIAGQLAAYELISNESVSRLDEFRPGRVFKAVTRY